LYINARVFYHLPVRLLETIQQRTSSGLDIGAVHDVCGWLTFTGRTPVT